jgi:hypothetical protein
MSGIGSLAGPAVTVLPTVELALGAREERQAHEARDEDEEIGSLCTVFEDFMDRAEEPQSEEEKVSKSRATKAVHRPSVDRQKPRKTAPSKEPGSVADWVRPEGWPAREPWPPEEAQDC